MKTFLSFFLLSALVCSLAFAQSDGKFVEYYDDGSLKVEGHFANGKKEGPWIYYYEGPGKKKKMEGIFKEGLKFDKWTTYYTSRAVKSEGKFLITKGESLKSGTWTWYHKSGVKMKEGNYKSGKKTGRWTEWNTLEIVTGQHTY